METGWEVWGQPLWVAVTWAISHSVSYSRNFTLSDDGKLAVFNKDIILNYNKATWLILERDPERQESEPRRDDN